MLPEDIISFNENNSNNNNNNANRSDTKKRVLRRYHNTSSNSIHTLTVILPYPIPYSLCRYKITADKNKNNVRLKIWKSFQCRIRGILPMTEVTNTTIKFFTLTYS